MMTEGRAKTIADGLLADTPFWCHKTIDYEVEPPDTSNSKLCFGAALFLEHVAPGGCRANVCFRIGLMTREFAIADLYQNPEVYSTVEEFIGQ
jgi:hypothetical protein